MAPDTGWSWWRSAKYRVSGHRYSGPWTGSIRCHHHNRRDYCAALVDIVRRERVDVYVPVCSPASSYYDAVAKPELSKYCEVLHCDVDEIEMLDDKYEFAAMADKLGLPTPDSHRISRAEQVAGFEFGEWTPTFSRAFPTTRCTGWTKPRCPGRRRLEPRRSRRPASIAEDNPWIMQAFVDGQEYCTHSTVRDGQVQVYCCESSAFQVNYEMVDKPEIEDWVRRFVEPLKLTGQVSFDFIEAADGRVFPIECNPRTHSAITMFYNHPDLARAYLESGVDTITPLPNSRPTYWIYHELWRLLSRPGDIPARLRVIARGKGAIFDWNDPLPFLLVHHAQIPLLLLKNPVRGKDWIRVDFNIGKLVEPAGD